MNKHSDHNQPGLSQPQKLALTGVLEEIRTRRFQQVAKGWTPEHDDQHEMDRMVQIAEVYLSSACAEMAMDDEVSRDRILDAIAVLVAAVESFDRKEACKEESR